MLSVEALMGFVAVIDAGSFSAAAERLGQTPSGISRTISRLETQLGVTLITRTTRRLDLTKEGEWLLARARQILADLQNTEDELAGHLAEPAGVVRLNAATPVLDHLVAPLAGEIMDRYPKLRLELVSGETVIDLIEERVDVAIRIGELSDSTLNARRLGTSRLRLLAAPGYTERHGVPRDVADLAGRHRTLGFTTPASLNIWPLRHDGQEGYSISPDIAASSGETLRHLALAGAGIVCLADYLTHADRKDGRLVSILETDTLPWSQPVWAVFYKQGALAPRVTVLVNLLADRLTGTLLEDGGMKR
jgi:DNA-binding transcriptional LysR family regulator